MIDSGESRYNEKDLLEHVYLPFRDANTFSWKYILGDIFVIVFNALVVLASSKYVSQNKSIFISLVATSILILILDLTNLLEALSNTSWILNYVKPLISILLTVFLINFSVMNLRRPIFSTLLYLFSLLVYFFISKLIYTTLGKIDLVLLIGIILSTSIIYFLQKTPLFKHSIK